jgi:hypothetical protein
MRREWLELQSVLKPESVITNVEYKDDRLYFRVDGHLFATVGMYTMHESHPMFKGIMGTMAHEHNTPEGIAEQEQRSDEINHKIDLFFKYRHILYASLFSQALKIYGDKGGEAFVEFVDSYVDIHTEEKGDKLLEEIDRNLKQKGDTT